MIFIYRAQDKQGQARSGTIEAFNIEAAKDDLREKGLSPLSIEMQQKKVGGLMGKSLKFLNRVKERDKVIFARQLSVMISANLPIVKALKILIDQTENEYFKVIISEIADEVNGGAKLSRAFSNHSNIFSNFFISMIKTGETSGKLDDVLNYLADQQEKDYDLISKVKGAMTYPIFIVVGMIAVGIAMMIFVIPKLTGMLTESGAELPITTKILIGTSDIFVNYWWMLIIMFVILISAGVFVKKTVYGAKKWSFIKLHFPIFGELFKKIYVVRFMRSMSTLLEGGVLLVDALKIVAEVVSDVTFKEIILATAKEVEDGNSIAVVFSKHTNIIPPMIGQMMAIGEQTGSLTDILKKVSDFFARDIDNMVANLVTLLEPIIMVVMGAGVALMVAAILLPMYNLANSF